MLSSLANGSLKRNSSNGQKSHGRQGQPIQQQSNIEGNSSSTNYKNNGQRTNSLPRHVSMMASSMRQQQHTNQLNSQQAEESLQDLSLQSLQWLESRGLYDNNNTTRQERNLRRASLPEQIQANGYYKRRSHHNHGGQSDAESDASGISWASGLKQNGRSRNESGSESERYDCHMFSLVNF